MTKEYKKVINNIINQCEDIELLDFVYQLLQKRCKHLLDAQ